RSRLELVSVTNCGSRSGSRWLVDCSFRNSSRYTRPQPCILLLTSYGGGLRSRRRRQPAEQASRGAFLAVVAKIALPHCKARVSQPRRRARWERAHLNALLASALKTTKLDRFCLV